MLDAIPIWGRFVATFVAVVVAEECGYRLGRVRSRQSEKEIDARVGGMVGAELGLLAFLVAFTFGLGTSRIDARRHVLLDDANAIGTAYLRAAMLPVEHGAQVRRLLHDYVSVRIAATQGASIEEAVRQPEDIHGQLWTEAVAAANADPRSVPVGLFMQALTR